MAFERSAYLAALHESAPKEAVAEEVRKLLALLGETEPSLAEELSSGNVNQRELIELKIWNQRLAPNLDRDRLGRAACRFWAVQTLVTTVLRQTALDPVAKYSPGIVRAMEAGGQGLFEVGQSQFEALGWAAEELAHWISGRAISSFAVIESPLGNSLPVQVVSDAAARLGLKPVCIEWNAPRNDRPSHGRTIVEAACECAETTAAFPLVVFIDDALTGTRLVKLFDALIDRVGRDRFLAIAMIFQDSLRRGTAENANLERLIRRVGEQGKKMEFPSAVIRFSHQRLFKIDSGKHVRWEVPIMWGDSDLIAGKRKVNLVFMLLRHFFNILADLAQEQSTYRPYLEIAWSQDTTGAVSVFAPGLLQSTFAEILEDLELGEIENLVWKSARRRFSDDYTAKVAGLTEEDVRTRWTWIRDEFLKTANARIGKQRAAFAWRAIDDTFVASFSEHKPKAQSDEDSSPYTLPFNSTIGALNLCLRARIAERVRELHELQEQASLVKSPTCSADQPGGPLPDSSTS